MCASDNASHSIEDGSIHPLSRDAGHTGKVLRVLSAPAVHCRSPKSKFSSRPLPHAASTAGHQYQPPTYRLKFGLQLPHGVRKTAVFRQQAVVVSPQRHDLRLEAAEVCLLFLDLVSLPVFETDTMGGMDRIYGRPDAPTVG